MGRLANHVQRQGLLTNSSAGRRDSHQKRAQSGLTALRDRPGTRALPIALFAADADVAVSSCPEP